MGFTVTLYQNISDANVTEKIMTEILTLDCVMKDSSSIVDPVLLLQGDITIVSRCNYCAIPSFRRKYFINDISTVRADLVEIHCHCDVLSTYWTYIRNLNAILKRQENTWNLYFNDGALKVYQNPLVYYRNFTNGFDGYNYVLAVLGKRTTSSE